MRPDEIARLLNDRVFTPFRVHLSSGESHDVRDPREALLSRRTLALALRTGQGNGFPEAVLLVSLPHITSLEPLPAQRGRKGA